MHLTIRSSNSIQVKGIEQKKFNQIQINPAHFPYPTKEKEKEEKSNEWIFPKSGATNNNNGY